MRGNRKRGQLCTIKFFKAYDQLQFVLLLALPNGLYFMLMRQDQIMGMKFGDGSSVAQDCLVAQVWSHNSLVEPVQGEVHVHPRSIRPDQPPTLLEVLEANPVLLHVSQFRDSDCTTCHGVAQRRTHQSSPDRALCLPWAAKCCH